MMAPSARPAPRLFGIPARDAAVVAVLRRGPSAWSHLGRWDLADGSYEPGSWIRANLYPQRCDLSPDGRWFAYLTSAGRGDWDAGSTYLAISRLPWLTALAAWGTCGTWTRGVHFVDDPDVQELGPADEGDTAELTRRYGLAFNPAVTFAVERRRDWVEAAGSPPRADDDVWDEQRGDRVVVEKACPADPASVLSARGRFAAFREGPHPGEPRVTDYRLARDGREVPLDHVQWADWAADGRLLVATTDGRLQIRSPTGDAVVHEVDLSPLRPDPQRSPAMARAW
jgi:hypothetical protein